MRGTSWRELVDQYPDEDPGEETHGHIAPARQPCSGSNRAVREQPKQCPVCAKQVNFVVQPLGVTEPGTNDPIVEYVIYAHTSTPLPVLDKKIPRLKRAVDE